jgi:hypothetical protein
MDIDTDKWARRHGHMDTDTWDTEAGIVRLSGSSPVYALSIHTIPPVARPNLVRQSPEQLFSDVLPVLDPRRTAWMWRVVRLLAETRLSILK